MESLGLHNLQVSKGSKRKKKRLGRGNSSTGNYSGRGMKGQRARSGGKSGLILKGVKGYLQRIPKSRGFKSLRTRMETVNLSVLVKEFHDKDIITPRTLLKKGLINDIQNGVKILGRGTISKKMNIQANAFSKSAKEAIEKAGGQASLFDIKPLKHNNKNKLKGKKSK